MVHTGSLRGALRWSAADEAQNRISAVRKTLDVTASRADAAPSAADASAGGRQELRQGLSELDAVRSFLQDHINTSNRQFLSTGDKDEQLHSALQHGLSELEDVRRRLVRVLATSTAAPPPQQQQPQPRPPAENASAPTGQQKAAGRPPSATTRRPASATTRNGAGNTADDSRRTLQDHAKRLFRGQRPATASVRSASGAGESMHGTTDGLKSATTRLHSRPSSATVRGNATASAARDNDNATGSAPNSAGVPLRRTASGGPRLMTGARARPTSAPTRRSASTASEAQHPHGTTAGTTAAGANGDTAASGQQQQAGAWNKYQDWAQRVMSSVHSRRVMKHRQALERERTGSMSGSSAYPPNADDGVPSGSSSAGPSPPTTAGQDPTSSGSAPPTGVTGAAAARQRPLSAAFAGLRRAQAAAGGSTGPGARPASATVRGSHGGAQSTAASATAAGANGRLDATAQALREQGNVAFQQKRYGDAADAYGKALALEPTSELLFCNRAAAQLMLGKYHAALADSQAAINIDPTHVKAHWRAAKACLYLGQTDQARSLYGQAQQLAQTGADKEAISAEARAADLIDQCRRCIRLREYPEAVKAADDILLIFPPSGPCSMPWLCLRAEATLHVDAADTLQTVTRFTNEDPQCAEAWYLRAKAVFYTGHDAASTTAALGFLARCRELDSKHSRCSVLQSSIEAFATLRDQGNAAYANGRWQEAYVAYTKCLAVDPYNSSLKAIILCNRSAVCIQCERWKDALDDITQSINSNPQNAKAYTRRARIFQHQGNLDAAVKDLQLAAQMYPSPENQERLREAIDARNRQQQQSSASAGPQRPGSATGAGSSFRYFNFAGGGGGGASRPSTAGASRPSAGTGGASRPQSASNGRGNPYTLPKAQAPKEPSHYEVLGVGRMVDEKAVTRAYRDAALKWHPDKWMTAPEAEKAKAEDMFKRISTAYTVLKDPTKRRQYDHSQF